MLPHALVHGSAAFLNRSLSTFMDISPATVVRMYDPPGLLRLALGDAQ
jgi:hypothetical protein